MSTQAGMALAELLASLEPRAAAPRPLHGPGF